MLCGDVSIYARLVQRIGWSVPSWVVASAVRGGIECRPVDCRTIDCVLSCMADLLWLMKLAVHVTVVLGEGGGALVSVSSSVD